MKVLVTGSSGKIGHWIVRELLAHGHSVRALDRSPLPRDLRDQGVETLYLNITDALAVLTAAEGCDAIVHTAAYPDLRGVTTTEVMQTNVVGTQNIIDAAEANNVPKVIVTSSIGALGFSFPLHPCLPDYLPVDAGHPRRPQDVYGLSKLMNEESAAAATRRSGLTTIVFRPPHVLDLQKSRQEGWLEPFIARRRLRRDSGLWAYIDPRDLAVAYRLAVEREIAGHHIFYTMADDLLVDAAPHELIDEYLPELRASAAGFTGNCFYDLTPARETLGFEAKLTWRSVVGK